MMIISNRSIEAANDGTQSKWQEMLGRSETSRSREIHLGNILRVDPHEKFSDRFMSTSSRWRKPGSVDWVNTNGSIGVVVAKTSSSSCKSGKRWFLHFLGTVEKRSGRKWKVGQLEPLSKSLRRHFKPFCCRTVRF